MKKPAAPQSDPNVLAVLHRAGKVWRGLIANTRTGKPSLVSTHEFTSLGGLDAWLDEHQAASVLCVLPAASVICRNCALPDAPPDQLEQALRLQAEAHVLGIAPPHRLAMAVLPNAPGETSRTGLILAWPQSASFDPPATNRPVTFVPDIACLAAVLNGQRPTQALMWLDRHDGSIALGLTHAAGAIFRCTREDAESAEPWQLAVGRTLAETALNVGHTGAFIETLTQDAQRRAASLRQNEAGFFLLNDLIHAAAARIQGAGDQPLWWSQYGIAAGALLARTGQLAALTQLRHSPPMETPSRVRKLSETLAHPRTAIAVVSVCVLLLMFGPLAFSGMRLLMLKWRFGDLKQQHASAVAYRDQLSMYQELQKQQAWPMTKLLADITTNAPQGIDLEMIRIEGGKDFAISGTAISYNKRSPQEVFALMQENLRKDGVFTDIVPQWGNPNNLGIYKFDLSGKVGKPYKEPNYPEERDFAKKTLAERLYGKPAATSQPQQIASAATATPTAPAPAATETSEEGTDEETDSGAARPHVTSGADDGAVMPGGAGGDTPTPHSIPEPITQEQVNVMTLPELQETLHRVAEARKYVKDDEEVSARLKKEFEMLMTQIRKVKGSSA